MEIPYTFSDDEVFLLLEALSSYRMVTESDMLTSFGEERVARCSALMSRISSMADRIKKTYFEAAKGACPHAG